MPYIKQDKRDVLDAHIDEIHNALVSLQSSNDSENMEGNINYIVTRLMRKCYGSNYAELNAAIGALECIKLEFYREIAAPYENQKKFENGDVEK